MSGWIDAVSRIYKYLISKNLLHHLHHLPQRILQQLSVKRYFVVHQHHRRVWICWQLPLGLAGWDLQSGEKGYVIQWSSSQYMFGNILKINFQNSISEFVDKTHLHIFNIKQNEHMLKQIISNLGFSKNNVGIRGWAFEDIRSTDHKENILSFSNRNSDYSWNSFQTWKIGTQNMVTILAYGTGTLHY